jgi:hypothetical protein
MNALALMLMVLGQHHPAAAGHHAGGHFAGAHVSGGHVSGGHAAVAGAHAAMESHIAHEALQQQAVIQHQREERIAHHEAMVKQDLPRLENYFNLHWRYKRDFDPKWWKDLRFHHHRLGVEAFWRLARKHKDIDKLLAALREEKVLREDSVEGRLGRIRARHEMWDLLAESRFEAYCRERTFDRQFWESLRRYCELLGPELFWRIAHEHREIEKLRFELSAEFRRKLLSELDEAPRNQNSNEISLLEVK